MELVPTLQTACLTTLCIDIWHHYDVNSTLVTYIKKSKRDKLPYMQLMLHLERILSDIMSHSTIPVCFRLQMAIAFLSHYKKMLKWAKDIKIILKHPKKAYMYYALAKTIVTQNGEIDRARTVLRILVHSYYGVKFKKLLAAFHFCANYEVKYGAGEPYWNLKLLSKVSENVMCCGEFREHVEEMTGHVAMDNNSANAVLTIWLSLARVTSLQVWKCIMVLHECCTSEQNCLLLVHSILEENPESNKIFHYYKYLSEDHQMIILKKFGIEIITNMYGGEQMEYCVELYSQTCKLGDSTCLEVLAMVFMQLSICGTTFSPNMNKTIYSRCKSVFLKMWHLTPSNKKNIFFEKWDRYLMFWRLIVKRADFNLLSMLACDGTFSQEQKDQLVLTSVLFWAETSKLENIKKFVMVLPDCYKTQFAETNAKHYLKQYIAKGVRISQNYKELTYLVFESQELADEFRKSLFMDKDFVVQALSRLSLESDSEDGIIKFLRWGFNDDDDSVKQFIDNKIRSENWLLDIYKTNLLNKRNGQNPLLNLFTTSDEEKSKLKKLVRADKEVLMQILDRAFVKNKTIGTKLFRCIFDKSEKKQKCAAIEEYFSSELGVKRVHQMLCDSVSICNTYLYFHHVLPDVIRTFFVIKKHWLVSSRLLDLLDEPFSYQSVEEYIDQNKRDYLPIERLQDYKDNANANLRLFIVILNINRPEHVYLNRLKNNISLLEQGVDTMLTHLFS